MLDGHSGTVQPCAAVKVLGMIIGFIETHVDLFFSFFFLSPKAKLQKSMI